jgi:DNA polymerase-3 subunit delta'
MQFKNVVGQAVLKERLIHEVRSQKISHAQLFLGKPGHGGLSLALAFVQYLFCDQPSDNDSCGTCPSCRKVTELQHPDLHFSFPVVQAINKTSDPFLADWREQIKATLYFDLYGWTQRIDPKERKPIIGTQESQEIIRKLSLKSFEGGYKVMLIWMAEEMNTDCSNKLLKILEEPPAKTLFILLAEQQDKLLPTILSRTQLVHVPRIEHADLEFFIKQKHALGTEKSDSILSRSSGDVLTAIQLVAEENEEHTYHALFVNMMRVCYKKDVIAMLDWAEEIGVFGKEYQKGYLTYALHMFRQSMLRNYTNDQLTQVSSDEASFLTNFSRFISGKNLMDFNTAFNSAHFHVDRNASPKILFTELCFKVMRYIHFA